jgi:peptide/nickel transport system ATP-binding protein
MTPQKLLQVRDLTVKFSGQVVVDHVSFDLHRGECLGIVGASGSGKSVTSQALMRLLDRKISTVDGSVKYEGRELIDLTDVDFRPFRGKELAMVFQEPMTALDPVYTVGEQVAEAIRLHFGVNRTEARDRVISIFEEVLLPSPAQIFDRYPHQLSGGQKQRVVIAMALSCSPSVLICDEPTTALDVLVQREILDLLRRIQQERRMGMIFITHDLGVVKEIADRVLVMHKGQVVEEASIEDLFRTPKHPYTKGLMACRPDPHHHPLRLPTITDVMEGRPAWQEVPREERSARSKAMLQAPPILEVHELRKTYVKESGFLRKTRQVTNVLEDVAFSVHPGESLGIVGGSGSGKTTLGRCILQLIQPTSGRVSYRPHGSTQPIDLSTLDASEMRKYRRDLQIIFQDPYSSLDPRLSVGGAIAEAMEVHGIGRNSADRRKRTIALLEKVGLEAVHFDRFPHQFSGGQRQRIVIARALALEPRVIICDESVAALDVSVQAQVLNLLNDLKDEHGLTYLLISHDLNVVKYFCDRILVLEKGRNVELRPADDLYNDPQSSYARALIDAIPGK